MRKLIYITIPFLYILISCDKGLSPNLADEKVGFGGTVTFSGQWDPDIIQTHVVAFENPLLDVSDFNVFNLKYVSPSIPNGTTSYSYTTNDEEALISSVNPGTLSYIAVAQSLKDTITLNRADWVVIGLYYQSNDSLTPGRISVPESGFLDNINIHCDFANLPPQPPDGNINRE